VRGAVPARATEEDTEEEEENAGAPTAWVPAYLEAMGDIDFLREARAYFPKAGATAGAQSDQ